MKYFLYLRRILHVPEAHIVYFIWRCLFLNCSEEKVCMVGVGGRGVQVRNVTLRTSRWGVGGGERYITNPPQKKSLPSICPPQSLLVVFYQGESYEAAKFNLRIL
jgi:hypothetical protein